MIPAGGKGIVAAASRDSWTIEGQLNKTPEYLVNKTFALMFVTSVEKHNSKDLLDVLWGNLDYWIKTHKKQLRNSSIWQDKTINVHFIQMTVNKNTLLQRKPEVHLESDDLRQGHSASFYYINSESQR